jgi:hypothetical protein
MCLSLLNIEALSVPPIITSVLSNHESFIRQTMHRDSLILDGDRKTHELKQSSLSHDYIKTSNHQISFRIYPACNRLVRRFAKRTFKRKLYRKCKEKHKTWERYRNRIMEEYVSQSNSFVHKTKGTEINYVSAI